MAEWLTLRSPGPDGDLNVLKLLAPQAVHGGLGEGYVPAGTAAEYVGVINVTAIVHGNIIGDGLTCVHRLLAPGIPYQFHRSLICRTRSMSRLTLELTSRSKERE